jgi:hypothetical protein
LTEREIWNWIVASIHRNRSAFYLSKCNCIFLLLAESSVTQSHKCWRIYKFRICSALTLLRYKFEFMCSLEYLLWINMQLRIFINNVYITNFLVLISVRGWVDLRA